MRVEQAPSYPASIFIAGALHQAEETCRAYCDEFGFCVTVTPTNYIYTGGSETGVIVGLINYPRFPSDAERITYEAVKLGVYLREALGQDSFSVQTPEQTIWLSWRAAGCDSDGTAIAALCEDIAVPKDCQARAVGIAQTPSVREQETSNDLSTNNE